MNGGRPKLNLPKTRLERVANNIGYAGFMTMILFIVLNWSSLPESVPTHFNIAGEADGWGNKWSLVILPFITIFLHSVLERVERNPHTHNYSASLTAENAPQFYLISRQTLNLTKNICTWMFVFISISSVQTALGQVGGLNTWWMILFGGALVGVIIHGRIRMGKIK